MFRQVGHRRATNRAGLGVGCCFGQRTTWSRAAFARADSNLAPCMVRPNLFSGD
jgi:hypothetical protein